MQKIIKIRNLDCANCAAELSEELGNIEGIKEAYADFINQRVTLDYENEEALQKAIDDISHFEEVEIVEGNFPQKKQSRKKEIISIAISAALFVPALILQLFHQNKWVVFSLYLGSFLAAGWSVVLNIFRLRSLKFLLDENVLMTLAAIGAFVIWEPMEGAAVMLLYQIGELLQSIAVGSSRREIKKLLEMKSDEAILLTDGEQRKVDPETLKTDDLILLRKGDKIPADCVLIDGETSLDTKSLTGEAYFSEVKPGDELLAGSVNAGNPVKAKILRPVSESAVAKILDMVENSAAKKAKPEKFITKFARVYTPIVVLAAILIAAVPPLIFHLPFNAWLVPAIEFLVISCPCALIISVPLTYFSSVGALANRGVLAKGAVYLDELGKAQIAVFDKTGTLTEGKFSISRVNGKDRVLSLAAAVEKNSSHPLAQAFSQTETNFHAEAVEEIPGLGLSAIVDGKRILVGSAKLMQQRQVEILPSKHETSASIIYVAEDGILVGSIEIEDRVRREAKEVLETLKKEGIKYRAVLTGDSFARAGAALHDLPLDEIHADLLPEQKQEIAERLKEKGKLLYVGDGINDAPVLTASDVSVAMGGLGSGAAIEASDFVLVSDSLSALPTAFKAAKKTRRIVKENIIFSIAVKAALMVCSLTAVATGLFSLPIWAAVFGDVGVMLLAVLNSMRMRKF